MTNIVNLWAETDASMIGDDSTPTLTLGNSSTGVGLKVTNTGTGTGVNVDSTGSTGAGLDVVSSTRQYGTSRR